MSRSVALSSLRLVVSIAFVALGASTTGCAGITPGTSGAAMPSQEAPGVAYQGVAPPTRSGDVEAAARAERIASVVERVTAERVARRAHAGRHSDE